MKGRRLARLIGGRHPPSRRRAEVVTSAYGPPMRLGAPRHWPKGQAPYTQPGWFPLVARAHDYRYRTWLAAAVVMSLILAVLLAAGLPTMSF
jgi:hypothetical protein